MRASDLRSSENQAIVRVEIKMRGVEKWSDTLILTFGQCKYWSMTYICEFFKCQPCRLLQVTPTQNACYNSQNVVIS